VEGRDWWLSGRERQDPLETPRSQYIVSSQDIADSTSSRGKWDSILQLSANVCSASRRLNIFCRPVPTALKTKLWGTPEDLRKTTNFVEYHGLNVGMVMAERRRRRNLLDAMIRKSRGKCAKHKWIRLNLTPAEKIWF
jgi:hypothetical protein